MSSEASLIAQLQTAFPRYIGDDAAILPVSQSKQQLISKDLLIEDVHFSRAYTPADALAHKALEVNLSDIAAMGACPEFVLLGIAIPPQTGDYAEAFLRAFVECCKKRKVYLLGGDTTASYGGISISVTIIGSAKPDTIVLRNTAQMGDIICVAGQLGYSKIGLTALGKKLEDFAVFKEAHLYPKAKIEEGQWLATQLGLHSMMDISDGLYLDLHKLSSASGYGAQIVTEKLPLSADFVSACQALNQDPITTLLEGGEDYALLCTIAPEHVSKIATLFQQQFGYSLHAIGSIAKELGLHIFKKNRPIHLPVTPFSHFGEFAYTQDGRTGE